MKINSINFYKQLSMTVRPIQIPAPDSSVGRASDTGSKGLVLNPVLAHHYISHPDKFGAVPTPGTSGQLR